MTQDKDEPIPDITRVRSLEEYEDLVVKYAKYFAVTEIRPGAWRYGRPNFIRTEHLTYEDALTEAKRRYDIEAEPKRGSLIYAVADFPGARNMSTLVECYPDIGGRYTRKWREEKPSSRKIPKSLRDIPPPGTLPPSERHFEGEEYKKSGPTIVKPGSSQRALRYKNKHR